MPWFVKVPKVRIHPKRLATLLLNLTVLYTVYIFLKNSRLKNLVISPVLKTFALVFTKINMYGHLVYPILFIYTILTLLLRKTCSGLLGCQMKQKTPMCKSVDKALKFTHF